MTDKDLIKAAENAMQNAYAPYSGFKVGAAVLSLDNELYCGCNIENASYPAGTCAERTAIGNAISNGKIGFSKIAVVGGKNGIITDFCLPCGICRQVLSEFGNEDSEIILYNGAKIKSYRLSELLPLSFGRESLC